MTYIVLLIASTALLGVLLSLVYRVHKLRNRRKWLIPPLLLAHTVALFAVIATESGGATAPVVAASVAIAWPPGIAAVEQSVARAGSDGSH